ncbi:hypothetical protein PMAYCL1PPCAC_26181, partial [Pristionchus mayeri]
FFFLSVERLVATFAWAWSEKESALTIVIFIILEGSAVLWSWGWAIFEVLSDLFFKDFLKVVFSSSFLVLYEFDSIVIAVNYRVVRQINTGARINQYSVARSFQIRENVVILTVKRLCQ